MKLNGFVEILKANFHEAPLLTAKHESYFDAYAEEFSQYVGKPIIFVEIGVMNGGSLFMWRSFFGANARIIGIDFNPGAKKLEQYGFEIYIGSQSDAGFWRDFFVKVGDVDVVLDDGGHTYKQQVVTANACLPHIRDGGKLMVEDVHTSYFPSFGYPSKYSFINWAKSKVDRLNFRSASIEVKPKAPSDSIHSVKFYESIVCLTIDRAKCKLGAVVQNGGASILAQGYRYKDSLLERIEIFELKLLSSFLGSSNFGRWFVGGLFGRFKRMLVIVENNSLKSGFD